MIALRIFAPGLPRRPAAARTRAWVIGALLCTCILSGYLLSFNVDQPAHNGDWYIRYQVTCSIVEHNSFAIQPYKADARAGPGVGGHIYAQYTLGQTTALIPLYVLGRALAGIAHTNCASPVAPPIVFLTAKTLDLILGALLCALFFATARLLGYAPRLALTLTFLLAFGTSLWPDVLSNLEHTMESLFLLAGAYAALRYTLARRPARLWVLVMGVAAGLVFVTRVAGVIALPIFALYLVVLHHRRHRLLPQIERRGLLYRDLALYAAGTLPSILINATYDVIRFGSPLRMEPYPDHSLGFPPWFGIPDLLVSPGKGLLWYTPAVILLVLAARPFRRRFPLPAILFAIICGVYLLFYANVVYWHGDPAWGPRYLYAVLPYLIMPLGEVLRRYREYGRWRRRGVLGVLAASFLVQGAAVTVSYWRQYHAIFAYHGDLPRHYIWGFNLNYTWHPLLSPIVFALKGIAEITRTYVSHAPLLVRPAAQSLGSGGDPCGFRVYGHVWLCLTDADQLRLRANWNTFTPWWLHTYPWWSARTVAVLAVCLLAVFLVSAAALIRSTKDTPPPTAAASDRADPRGATHPGALLGRAALTAAGLYACIMIGAAAAPHAHAAPMLRRVAMGAMVTDGTWWYRVVDADSISLVGDPDLSAPPGFRYTAVTLQLHNLLPHGNHFLLAYWGLTDLNGTPYPRATDLDPVIPALYGLEPAWTRVPGHTTIETALAFLTPSRARHLALIAPGIALIPLTIHERGGLDVSVFDQPATPWDGDPGNPSRLHVVERDPDAHPSA